MIALETSGKSVKSLKRYKGKQSHGKVSVTHESEQSDEDAESEDERNSDCDAQSEDSQPENEEKGVKANAGWADVMQKILKTNKPKKKKTLVLSKAKKLSEVKPRETVESLPFELETEDGKVKKEILAKEEIKTEDESGTAKKKRKVAQLGIRVKPSIQDRQRERALQKIATKGVVQLFNVVRQQQMEIDRKIVEAGPLERKREKVLKSIDKRAFLDVLMGGSKSIQVDDTNKSTKDENDEDNKADKVWNVLRDDFVMGANLKDWDKKAPEETDDSTSSEEMDSD